jgi:hypothetical protein
MSQESVFRDIFFRIIVFFLALGWLVLLLSAIGILYRETVLLSIIIGLSISLYIKQNKRIGGAKHFGKTSIIVFLIALGTSFSTCYYAAPTVFGGRDQGSIATAAIYFSENHGRKIENPIAQNLFQKYGPGKALNYPGFDYEKDGKLVSRFPIGYTAYLASVYSFFGLEGIQYANLIPLLLFLFFFWLTLHEFFSEKVSFLGFLLAATFFPFLWFAKYTLTETYMLFLVWAGIYFLIASLRDAISKSLEIRSIKIFVALAALGLSSLVRIEGIAFFLLAVGYILILERKKLIALPKNFKKILIISILAVSALYLYLNFPTLSDSFKNIAKSMFLTAPSGSIESPSGYWKLAILFFNYNFLIYLVLGIAALIYLIRNFKDNFQKRISIPLLILFPSFVYLLFPFISADDPWMFRRYVFAVFPLLLFYSIFALSRFLPHKKFLYLVFAVLLAANAMVSCKFIKMTENKNLFPEIEKISQKFGPKDLVLVDRLATGSGWSLMSEPMNAIFRKNAVYFFNAEDLEFINKSRYEHIYLIAQTSSQREDLPARSATENDFWYRDLIAGKNFTRTELVNNYLEPSKGFLSLATNIKATFYTNIWKIK